MQYKILPGAAHCNNTSDYILTATQCDFMDDNYYFIFKVKTLKCQIGEYYSNEECLKCDFEKGFYSVEVNSTSCQKMDPEFIKSISLSSIELQKGYWRLSYYQNNIEKCDNNEVCLGGEQVSYNSCKIGYLGAICGACDLYNIGLQNLQTLLSMIKITINKQQKIQNQTNVTGDSQKSLQTQAKQFVNNNNKKNQKKGIRNYLLQPLILYRIKSILLHIFEKPKIVKHSLLHFIINIIKLLTFVAHFLSRILQK